MAKHEFDAYADSYEDVLEKALAKGGGGDSVYYAQRKFIALTDFYREKKLSPPTKILDFGCGVGINLSFLRKLFPEALLHGVDVSSRSIRHAHDLNLSNCNLAVYDGKQLPYQAELFDLVVVSNVLHHIDPEDRYLVLKEIARCMRPGGYFVLFEHNPYNPVTRKVVRDCPFDVGVTLVKAKGIKTTLTEIGFDVKVLWNITFFPKTLQKMNMTERYLRWLPLGAQYVLFATWKGL